MRTARILRFVAQVFARFAVRLDPRCVVYAPGPAVQFPERGVGHRLLVEFEPPPTVGAAFDLQVGLQGDQGADADGDGFNAVLGAERVG